MNSKKAIWKRLLAGGVAAGMILLAGCGPKPAADGGTDAPAANNGGDKPAASTETVKIVVGTQPTTMGTPLDYAMKRNWFEGSGIEIDRVLFPTGAPINEALAAEQLDIAINGLATVYAVAAGDVTWIGEINTASGLNVYVRPDSPILEHKGEISGLENVYGSADTVNGITILGPLGTSSQFNAIAWTEKFGLTASDYQMLSMDHGPAAQAFLTGEGDAIASSPPYTYTLADAGMIPVAPLEDVSGITLTDGVCVRNDYLEKNRDAVKKFMEIIYRAQDELGADDKVAYDSCFEYYNENGREYDDKSMTQEIAERDFVDKKMMSDPDYRFGSVIIGMGEFYIKDGKIDEADRPNIVNGLDPSVLEEIYGIKIPIYQAAS